MRTCNRGLRLALREAPKSSRHTCSRRRALASRVPQIFLERFNIPPNDARRTHEGLYHVHTYGPVGRRVQMIMLDTRWFRSPFLPTAYTHSPDSNPRLAHRLHRQSACALAPLHRCHMCPYEERYVAYNGTQSASETMLGEGQWRWLAEVLSQPADVRLLISTVQVLPTGHGWEYARLDTNPAQHAYAYDCSIRAASVRCARVPQAVGADPNRS